MTHALNKHMENLFGMDALAFFFDFDGTLVTIADTPEGVCVPRDLSEHLQGLSQRAGQALAIITGRPIAAIDRLFDPYRFDVAGVHGLERRIASATLTPPARPSTDYEAIVAELKKRFGAREGIRIEDKGYSVAVHWRLRPGEAPEVLETLTEASRRLGPSYRIQLGKSVAELLPARSGKGRAIELMMAHAPYRGRKPVFFGDDLTDEEGFAAVNRMAGLSVRVGNGMTQARLRLAEVARLRTLIGAWAGGAPVRVNGDSIG